SLLNGDGALPCQIADVASDDSKLNAAFDSSFRQVVMPRAARLIGRDECLMNQHHAHHSISRRSCTAPSSKADVINLSLALASSSIRARQPVDSITSDRAFVRRR